MVARLQDYQVDELMDRFQGRTDETTQAGANGQDVGERRGDLFGHDFNATFCWTG